MNRSHDIAAAALVELPRATPTRLRSALRAHGGPELVVEAIRTGSLDLPDGVLPGDLAERWRGTIDLALGRATAILSRRATRVFVLDGPDWPIPDDIPAMPAVLLAEGVAFEVFDRPRIAIVGTRHPTPHGTTDARELGAAVADAGAVVVSGLANGIDGAAHEGAIAAGGLTIGVAATGLDVPYPAGNAALWTRVRNHGVIVGENPFGTHASRQIFPVRNRIIAALAACVIIPEASASGGTMSTAQWALDLGRDLYAIPGSRRNPMAEGCNRLIADGAHPLLDPADLGVALSRGGAASVDVPAGRRPVLADVSSDARRVHRAFGGEPATLDQLVARTGASVAMVAGAARELERSGRLHRAGGRLWPA